MMNSIKNTVPVQDHPAPLSPLQLQRTEVGQHQLLQLAVERHNINNKQQEQQQQQQTAAMQPLLLLLLLIRLPQVDHPLSNSQSLDQHDSLEQIHV